MALLGPNSFGRYGDFLNRYFEFDYFGRPIPLPGTQKAIEDAIRHVVLRKDIADEIDMPPITEQTIRFDLPPKDRDMYDEIEAGIDMESGEMAYTPLRCVCSGFRYREDELGRRSTERLHDEKISLLNQIQIDNPGEPLLVVTNFRAERQAIVNRYDCPFVDGETKTSAETVNIDRWNAGELPMMVIHPRAMGHGVNLQTGGRMVVWFSPPDDGELYDQTNARIWRGGQEKPVVITKLIASDTIEETIDYLLRKKLLNQRNLLEALTNKR
jgi:SNF2 family DNA or RNA helicase